MEKDLQKIKTIFLSQDIDSEEYEDNLKQITDWENSLRENEDFKNWKESDVTKSIIEQAKKTYKDNAMRLISDRNLTEAQRLSIWSKQDACIWLLSLIDKDVKDAIRQIHSEIRKVLSVI